MIIRLNTLVLCPHLNVTNHMKANLRSVVYYLVFHAAITYFRLGLFRNSNHFSATSPRLLYTTKAKSKHTSSIIHDARLKSCAIAAIGRSRFKIHRLNIFRNTYE